MGLSPEAVAAAYRHACLAELDALKPGNVHRFAPGHRMRVEDFETSAAVSAPFVAAPDLIVGLRVLKGVEATFAAVGMNTNLGILLLAAPLAAAAQIAEHAPAGSGQGRQRLHEGVCQVLAALGAADADATFSAIASAAPGGLGDEPVHDVRAPATIGVIDAMRIAAPRDRIAFQYASSFEDVFATGLPALAQCPSTATTDMWPTIHCFFAFATRFKDSHVERKYGLLAAERLRERLASAYREMNTYNRIEDRLALLLALDAGLKSEGLNPGTTADLTVASVFAASLADQLEE